MADTVVALAPGVMCSSPEALAALTLPDGSSRSALAGANAADHATAQRGGCIDIPLGAHLTVRAARKNTSIVAYDAGDGRGPLTFIVPNVDVSGEASVLADKDGPVWSLAARPFWSAVLASCPQRGWSGRALARMEVGSPLDPIYDTLTPVQKKIMEQEGEAECVAGVACPSDIQIGFLVRLGRLPEMVRAMCSVNAPG